MKSSKLLNLEPYKYQVRGVQYALDHPYCIIGDEMGLGKTLQGIMLYLETRLPTLIIGPAYLRDNWWNEIEEQVKTWENVEIVVNADDLAKVDLASTDIVIIGYNLITGSESLFKWADLVIADECQALKEPTTGWTIAFNKFIYDHKPERLLLLSGTPIKNRVQEWYSLLVLMSYIPHGDNGESVCDLFTDQKQFCKFFSFTEYKSVGGRFVEKYHGIRNERRLKQLLKGKYIRRLAKNELELPDIIRKNIIVDYRDDRELLEAWNKFVSGTKSTNSRSKATSAAHKAPFTAKYCRDIYQEIQSPIVIFTDHRESAAILAKDLKAPKITGETKMSERSKIVKEFQKGKYSYLVGTIGAMGAGNTLTAASDVVFNDESWVPADNWQAWKRIHRIGQERTCRIHKVYGSPQDKYISGMLLDKEDTLRRAL